MSTLHPSIRHLKLPRRMRKLTVDERGFVVPWFVAWPNGAPDHRAMDGQKLRDAIRDRLCWVCGEKLGAFGAFVIGPMCAVNRTTAEPPSHRDCAEYSARACPFLTRPHAKRRPIEYEHTPPAGGMIRRNPGVTLVWITKRWTFEHIHRGEYGHEGVLVRLHEEPEHVLWFCEGRAATRAEVEESVESGLPALQQIADQQDVEQPHVQAGALLARQVADARRFWPADLR